LVCLLFVFWRFMVCWFGGGGVCCFVCGGCLVIGWFVVLFGLGCVCGGFLLGLFGGLVVFWVGGGFLWLGVVVGVVSVSRPTNRGVTKAIFRRKQRKERNKLVTPGCCTPAGKAFDHRPDPNLRSLVRRGACSKWCRAVFAGRQADSTAGSRFFHSRGRRRFNSPASSSRFCVPKTPVDRGSCRRRRCRPGARTERSGAARCPAAAPGQQ